MHNTKQLISRIVRIMKKIINLRKLSLLSMGLLLLSSLPTVQAAVQENEQDDEPKPFFSNSQEGYFWYKDPKEKKKAKPFKVTPPKVVVTVEPKKEPKKENKGPNVGSFQWIHDNLKSYRKLALDNPTVENMKAYMYMQRLALDRSEQFANAGRLAVEGDPLLDAITRSPIGGSASVKRQAHLSAEKNNLAQKIYQKVGIFYVFKDRCAMCDEQAGVLEAVRDNFGAEVKAVSLDEPTEGSISAEKFPDYVVDPKAVSYFKIFALPATFVYAPQSDEIKPLLQGMVTLSDFNSRMISLAQKERWLPQQDFYFVKPHEDSDSLSGLFDSKSKFAKKLQESGKKDPYGKETNFIDPKFLVEQIQKAKNDELPDDYIPRGY